MKTTAGSRNQPAVHAFTLIELLLTVVLIMLLAGALVVNFSAMQSTTQLDESAEQLESVLRFSRAHATSTGCKVRLTFEELVSEDLSVPMGNLFVEWEPDPLRRPGYFEPLREVAMLVESMLDGAEIDDVRPLDGPSASATSNAEAEGEMMDESAPLFPPITFFPDGSSDSAEIILASRDEQEVRRISVSLVGATGVIRRKAIVDSTAAEEEEFFDFVGE